MFKTTTDFKIGQLNTLENQLFEITKENQQLNFHIEGRNNKNIYSLDFISIISLEEMLKFNLNEHIDFIQYVDDGDISIWKNGIYDLNTEIKIDIMRYLPSSFIIIISFKNRDNLVGLLNLVFLLKVVNNYLNGTI